MIFYLFKKRNKKQTKMPRQTQLQIFIETLLDSGVFIELPSNKYACICGSRISRSSVRNHTRTNKHVSFMRHREVNQVEEVVEEKIEEQDKQKGDDCDICYQNKNNWFSCKRCTNSICMDCRNQVTKCPFCRLYIGKVKKISSKVNTDFSRLYQRFINDITNHDLIDQILRYIEHYHLLDHDVSSELSRMMNNRIYHVLDILSE